MTPFPAFVPTVEMAEEVAPLAEIAEIGEVVALVTSAELNVGFVSVAEEK